MARIRCTCVHCNFMKRLHDAEEIDFIVASDYIYTAPEIGSPPEQVAENMEYFATTPDRSGWYN